MLTQIGGVTGRRRRDGRKEEVEARAPYLVNAYASRAQQDYQDRMASMRKDRMEQESAMARQALGQKKKQDKRANKLAMAGMSSNLGMGLGGHLTMEDKAEDTAEDAVKNIYTKLGGADSESGLAEKGLGGFLNDAGDKVSNKDGWTNALGNKASYVGMFNAPLGSEIGGMFGGGENKTAQRVIGGAVGSALTDAFMNPASDFYSSAMNAIGGGSIGGALSLF